MTTDNTPENDPPSVPPDDLAQTPYTYQVFKLFSGETIISGVIESEKKSKFFTLDWPMTIGKVVVPATRTTPAHTLVCILPWIEHCKEVQHDIPKLSVVTVTTPEEGILDHYKECKAKWELSLTDQELKEAEGDLQEAKDALEERNSEEASNEEIVEKEDTEMIDFDWKHKPRFNFRND